MPGQNTKHYTYPLSPTDDLVVGFTTRSRIPPPAELISFSVVLRTKIGKKWRTVKRYDNCHGYPHVHIFDWRGEISNTPLGDASDSAIVFNQAIEDLRGNFSKIRETFLLSKQRYEHR